jgi:hypothetical protein
MTTRTGYGATLDRDHKRQFVDVFADKIRSTPPPKGGPERYIHLKDENKPTNGGLIRIPTKCYLAMKRFIEENVKASRLRPSSSSTSSGTFIIHDTKVGPRLRLPSMNDNTIKDHSPLPR